MGFVSNDKMSHDYIDNFYDPYDRLPYNHQGKDSRTWDTFTARSEYHTSFSKLMGGIGETIVYGSSVEAAGTNPNRDARQPRPQFRRVYAMPFVLYVFAQHYLGDLDNAGLSFDINVKTLPHWEFYGEMLWDDMKKGTSMFDDSWWGNKWSASVGLTPLFKKVEDNSLSKPNPLPSTSVRLSGLYNRSCLESYKSQCNSSEFLVYSAL